MAWGVAYRFLGNATEAEDAAQEAFLKILEAAPRYRPTAAFRTFLYQVVTRLCIDRSRKKRPDRLVDSSANPSAGASPDEESSRRERDEAIQGAVGALPPNQRMSVVLRYFEGLSTCQIASTLNTSEKAVERLLARAREALEPRLARFFEK